MRALITVDVSGITDDGVAALRELIEQGEQVHVRSPRLLATPQVALTGKLVNVQPVDD